jgi:ATP-binding cassette subfamily B protein
MVLQHPHLFSGTVRDNIRYGRLDATDAEVRHAALGPVTYREDDGK